jgi:hypothetical protein
MINDIVELFFSVVVMLVMAFSIVIFILAFLALLFNYPLATLAILILFD